MKHLALPGEEQGVKIVVIAHLSANEKNPKDLNVLRMLDT